MERKQTDTVDDTNEENVMDESRTSGSNARPLDETIAGTGPGIADDALAPGQDMPEPPGDAETAEIADKLGVPSPEA
jgi:hypothetical protein